MHPKDHSAIALFHSSSAFPFVAFFSLSTLISAFLVTLYNRCTAPLPYPIVTDKVILKGKYNRLSTHFKLHSSFCFLRRLMIITVVVVVCGRQTSRRDNDVFNRTNCDYLPTLNINNE